MFNDLRYWYLNQCSGNISSSIKFAEKIKESIQKGNFDEDNLWPPCYFPADINDQEISLISQRRFANLSKIELGNDLFFNREKANKTWIDYKNDSYKFICFSYSLSTHINGFEIRNAFNSLLDLNVQIVRLPPFPSSLNLIKSNNELLENYKQYAKKTYKLISTFINKSICNPLIILDSNYGTLESLEMFSQIDSSIYFQIFGFHEPIFNSALNHFPQDWKINLYAIDKISTQIKNLSNKSEYSISFACAPYKYDSKFWSFIISILKLKQIKKIGLTFSCKLSNNIFNEFSSLSSHANKLEILNEKSKFALIDKIDKDYDFSIDMYKLGGSSLTPGLLKKGHPVFHQKTDSFFSDIQQKSYKMNKLSDLIVESIPVI
tara:strand:- start:5994 stop:7124 length:1131 start_codon:yes stop_codon:yes gene_type:complete